MIGGMPGQVQSLLAGGLPTHVRERWGRGKLRGKLENGSFLHVSSEYLFFSFSGEVFLDSRFLC